MPPFWSEEPELWFAQLESQYIICGINQDATKYAYALSQIDTKVAREIKDIVAAPPTDDKYSTLKRTLIQRLSASQEQRTRQLLEHEELGDRKPSQFLRHLQSLAGSLVPNSLLRTLWLGRLPAQMQVILATRNEDHLEEVAEQADRIHEVNYRAVVAAVEPTERAGKTLEDQMQELTKQVAALTSQFGKHQRRWKRDRSRSRSRSRNSKDKEGHCFYHQRFKEKARKCEQLCNLKTENGEGSR